MKKLISAILLSTLFAGCSIQDAEFAVYLADTDQLIFSEEDIASYEAATQTFTFTEEGVEKMQSYQSSTVIDAGLYQKSFIVKLGDEEIYGGKFWSNLSSLSEPGIVMYDVVMIGPDYNTLTVSGGYPSGQLSTDSKDQINDTRIIEHFKEIDKLK